jgi:NTP pyrophosphatase (non-canonical NTP hydrolase)
MIPKDLTATANAIRDWREKWGFYTPKSIGTEKERDMMLGKLMLIVTEIAEWYESDNPANLKEEIADTAIRIMDITAACDIDLDQTIARAAQFVFQGELMDLVACISHAAEAVRHADFDKMSNELGKAFWQITCFAQGHFDLTAAINAKMKVNWQRPIKHGKLCSL